jgi:hypothetical protein
MFQHVSACFRMFPHVSACFRMFPHVESINTEASDKAKEEMRLHDAAHHMTAPISAPCRKP